MNKFTVTSLVKKLIDEDKNILILDTCCLLDIIRCIQREKSAVLKSTIEIIELYDKNQNNFEIVLPSSIKTEYYKNCASVQAETKGYIHQFDKTQINLDYFFKMILPSTLNSTYYSQYSLEDILFGFSEKLLKFGFCLEVINGSIARRRYLWCFRWAVWCPNYATC